MQAAMCRFKIQMQDVLYGLNSNTIRCLNYYRTLDYLHRQKLTKRVFNDFPPLEI